MDIVPGHGEQPRKAARDSSSRRHAMDGWMDGGRESCCHGEPWMESHGGRASHGWRAFWREPRGWG